MRLFDLGEREIVSQLIIPRFPHILDNLIAADDCAVIDISNTNFLAQTCDPCPLPVVFDLFEPDYYHYGWLAVVINMSDLASMGANPVSLLVSIDAEKSMLVTDFNRLLDGIEQAASLFDIKVVGGNIRDTGAFAIHVSATGAIKPKKFMTRAGASAGQILFAIGNTGHFWVSLLLARKIGFEKACLEPQARTALVNPTVNWKFSKELVESGICSVATDASDGLLAAITSLVEASSLSLNLDVETLELDAWVLDTAAKLDIDPITSALGWGDWQLVVAIDQVNEHRFRELVELASLNCTYCGMLERNKSVPVTISHNEKTLNFPPLISKRFTPEDSQSNYSDWENIFSDYHVSNNYRT